MLDFKRIGGEILSAPLNENFRKLRNDINIINTNLVFDPEHSVVDTIEQMKNLEAVNGQWCYVVATGELFRYTSSPAPGEENWYKIGDFGKTFRQGFLNSGLVLMDGEMTWNAEHTQIHIPDSLVYFKAEPGDEKYVMGMYQIPAQDFTPEVANNGIYSLFIDSEGTITVQENLPTSHDVAKVYLGTFTKGAKGWESDLYTMPDMAYTSDRSYFVYNGAQVQGRIILHDNTDTKINLSSGMIYDEGINYTQGACNEYPLSTGNDADYNIKNIEATNGAQVKYMAPNNYLDVELGSPVSQLDGGHYYKNGQKTAVKEGQFTIQRYVVMPDGECRIIYGEEVYNSMDDAVTHFNELELFNPNVNLFTEIGRIALCYKVTNMNDSNQVQIANLTRLSTVGSLEPEFSDKEFMIYRGDSETSPNQIKLDLDLLAQDEKQIAEALFPLGPSVVRHKFYNNEKYNANGKSIPIDKHQDPITRQINNKNGYAIADQADVELLRLRVNDIEEELWKQPDTNGVDAQGVRHRLEMIEDDVAQAQEDIDQLEVDVQDLYNTKAHADTTINNFPLGNTKKDIVLKTDHIQEPEKDAVNLWYTDERVAASPTGQKLDEHIETLGTGSINDNAHALSTDDITLRDGTNKIFVTPEEERRIRADRLPNNTIDRLKELQQDKMSNIPVYVEGTSGPVGNFEKIKFQKDGIGIKFENNTYYHYVCGKDGLAAGKYYITVDGVNYSFTTTQKLIEGNELKFNSGTIEQITQNDITTLNCTTASATGQKLEVTSYTDNNTVVLDVIGHQNLEPYMLKSDYARIEEGVVDLAQKAKVASGLEDVETSGPSKYYGTNQADDAGNFSTGFFDLPKYVSTTTADEVNPDTETNFKIVPDEESIGYEHLTPELRNKVDNRYHEVFNNAQQKINTWKEIQEWNFGTGFVVDVENHRATISATGTVVDTSVMPSFEELHGVNITYTGNAGKTFVVNKEENGIELAEMPPLSDYMIESVYVDTTDRTKVKKAVQADSATIAETAKSALSIDGMVIDDTSTDNTSLWSAEKIIANTSLQIKEEGIKTFSDNNPPTDDLGDNGDLFILTN